MPGSKIVDAVADRVRREAPYFPGGAMAETSAVSALMHTHFYFLAIFVIL